MVVALLGVAAVVAWRELGDSVPDLVPRATGCAAEVGALSATLDLEQAENTALIVALGVRRGLPARAATIAIATAMQESQLYNIRYGDRDSLGLFQQRPSQGWGTPEQVMDPVHATERFYDGLVKVDGYEGLEVTVAAQTVQRSAFPDAYAQHEPEARALASALTGHSPRAFRCVVDTPAAGRPGVVRREVGEVFEGLVGAPVVRGRTVTVSVPQRRHAWALAHYLLAQSERLGLRRVATGRWEWTAEGSEDGWVRLGRGVPGQVVVDVAGPTPT
jgi:hypothetical protein